MKLEVKRLDEKFTEDVKTFVEGILKQEAIELVDVSYVKESHGWVLRVLIDKNGGVNIDDCSKISRQLSDLLDVYDVVPYAYKLEVSSPGLNRPLSKEKDFIRFIGRKVRLMTLTSIVNRKNFKGRLTDYKENSIFLEIDGKSFVIPREIVKKANLEYDFNRERK